MSQRIPQFIDLFGGEPAEKPDHPRAHTVQAHLRSAAQDGDHLSFLQLLKSVFKEQSLAAAGSFHIFGLEMIKEQLGQRWPELEDKIHALVRRVIESYIDACDLYTRHGDLDYLIVFSSLSKSDARYRCVEIFREIRAYLRDYGELPDISMRTVVGIVDNQLITEDQSLEELVAAIASRVEEDILVLEESPAQPPQPTLPYMPNRRSSQVRDWAVGASVVFRPIWDVRREAISTFSSTLCKRFETGDLYGWQLLPREPTEADLLLLDMLTLGTATSMLAQSIAKGIEFLLIIPVSYTSLIAPAMRDRYSKVLRDITREEQTYLLFEVTGAPREVPSSQLMRIAATLGPISRGLIFATTLGHRSFDILPSARFVGVSADIGMNRQPEASLMPALDTFAQRAEAARFDTYIHGVRSSSVALSALTAGISYIDGDRMSAVLEGPSRMSHYSWADFYDRHLSTA